MKETVVLVTGASSGIGKETARLLKSKGYRVYAAARRKAKMRELEGQGITALYMDMEDENSIAKAVEEVIEKEGYIDVLVNNAGFGIYGAVEDVPISEAKRQFEVNVFGLVRLTQLVLPCMRRQRWGKIVNISSVAGRMSMPLGAWYHASKHAVEAISDSLRGEVAPFGIDVMIIEPGIIDTAWWPIAEKNLRKVSGETAYADLVKQGEAYLGNPGRSSRPEEVARVILKAIRAPKPKARYRVGEKANLIVAAKEILPDHVFDRIMAKNLKHADK